MPPPLVKSIVGKYGRTLAAVGELYYEFNCQILNAVFDIVACVKPQRAFYEMYGPAGDWAFVRTVAYAKSLGLQVIEDGKRGDGGDTAEAYADGHLGEVPMFGKGEDVMDLITLPSPTRVDCLTVHGYIGEDCVCRFITRGVKEYGTGIFVVTKTSFTPNSRVEQLVTRPGCEEHGLAPTMVWQELARMVEEWGVGTEGESGIRNVGVVMGATYPKDAPTMREILPNAMLLIPGFGRQGGGADAAVVGLREDGLGGIVNNSRGLIYAWQKGDYACEPEKFAEAARKQALADRLALAKAAKNAGKWPFDLPTAA